MRKSVLLIASMVLGVLLAGGVALAAEIACPNRSGILCVGTAQNDSLTGTSGSDDLRGAAGNDNLDARAGNDRLTGNVGDDALKGGEGNDTYFFTDNQGTDRIPEGGEGGGMDTLSYRGADLGVKINLLLGHVRGTSDLNFSPSMVVIEKVLSGKGDDEIIGHGGADHLVGHHGDDRIYGRGGDDTLGGGVGADYISGDAGDDGLNGASGPDTYAFQLDSWGIDYVNDSIPDDSDPSAGNTLAFHSGLTQALTIDLEESTGPYMVVNESGKGRVNSAYGEVANVTIGSNSNDDTINGTNYPNSIVTHGGSDTVSSGAGDDVIHVDDGAADDEVDCGEGGLGITDNDTVYADTGDTAINCETVNP